MGKTALATNMIVKAVRTGLGVYFLSLEMSAAQIGHRFLAESCGIPASRMPAT
jgi:replicative DNA helicase